MKQGTFAKWLIMNREEVGDNLLLLLFFRERLRTHKAVGKLSFGPDKVKDYGILILVYFVFIVFVHVLMTYEKYMCMYVTLILDKTSFKN